MQTRVALLLSWILTRGSMDAMWQPLPWSISGNHCVRRANDSCPRSMRSFWGDYPSNKETLQRWSQRRTPLGWNLIGSFDLRFSAVKGHNQSKIESRMIHVPPLVDKPLKISWEFHCRAHHFWVLIQRQQWKNYFLHQIDHEDDIMHQKFRILDRIYPVFAFMAPPLIVTPIFQCLSTPQAKNDTTIKSIIYRACIYCADLSIDLIHKWRSHL